MFSIVSDYIQPISSVLRIPIPAYIHIPISPQYVSALGMCSRMQPARLASLVQKRIPIRIQWHRRRGVALRSCYTWLSMSSFEKFSVFHLDMKSSMFADQISMGNHEDPKKSNRLYPSHISLSPVKVDRPCSTLQLSKTRVCLSLSYKANAGDKTTYLVLCPMSAESSIPTLVDAKYRLISLLQRRISWLVLTDAQAKSYNYCCSIKFGLL